MALEVATYISELVSTNPPSGDQVSQGDDHLRLVKTVLQNSFPGITGAMTVTHTLLNGFDARITAVEGFSSTSPTFTGGTFTVQLTGEGAEAGPTVDLTRISTTPVLADLLGIINFKGKNSNGDTLAYAQIFGSIFDPTLSSEDGRLNFQTVVAGSQAVRGYFQNGLVLGAPTGADKGLGTINAVAFYDDNVQILPITVANVQGAYSSELGAQIWHSLNDGAGSGLDADLLDGVSSAGYVQVAGAQAVKAWVYSNNTGTILASHNVTSVTDNGSGHYTINFTTPLATANYAVVGMGQAVDGSANVTVAFREGDTRTTSAVQIRCKRLDTPTACFFSVMVV